MTVAELIEVLMKKYDPDAQVMVYYESQYGFIEEHLIRFDEYQDAVLITDGSPL